MFTAQQKAEIADVVARFKHVEGSYEATMLKGLWHGYCDSGILTDALSVRDAKLVSKYFKKEAYYNASIYAMDEFIESVEGEGLECVAAARMLFCIDDDEEAVMQYVLTLL